MLVHECSVGAAETAATPKWLRGYGILPYPPNPLSVGVFVGGNVRFV